MYIKRQIISAHRLTEKKVITDYPELQPLTEKKNRALNALHAALSLPEYIQRHREAKVVCLRYNAEINTRYQVLV